MSKLKALLSHLTVILSLMFLTFLVLDQFNPMMNFVDHPISCGLLTALCVCGIARSVILYQEKKE